MVLKLAVVSWISLQTKNLIHGKLHNFIYRGWIIVKFSFHDIWIHISPMFFMVRERVTWEGFSKNTFNTAWENLVRRWRGLNKLCMEQFRKAEKGFRKSKNLSQHTLKFYMQLFPDACRPHFPLQLLNSRRVF